MTCISMVWASSNHSALPSPVAVDIEQPGIGQRATAVPEKLQGAIASLIPHNKPVHEPPRISEGVYVFSQALFSPGLFAAV